MNVVPYDAPPPGSVRATSVVQDGVPNGAVRGFDSGIEYKPPSRGKHCIGNDNTCEGWKAKDTNYCAGHLKAQAAERERRIKFAAEVNQ